MIKNLFLTSVLLFTQNAIAEQQGEIGTTSTVTSEISIIVPPRVGMVSQDKEGFKIQTNFESKTIISSKSDKVITIIIYPL